MVVRSTGKGFCRKNNEVSDEEESDGAISPNGDGDVEVMGGDGDGDEGYHAERWGSGW
jgi:hypothetical protein